MPERAPVLEVSGIEKSFGRLVALDRISFSLEEKKITVLIGPNGSGKTTLVNIISGFYKPDAGEVFYRSQKITGLPPHEIYKRGLVRTFQIPSLFGKLTVLENLLVAGKDNPGESILRAPFKRTWEKHEEREVERTSRILEVVGLAKQWDKQASNLS